MGFTLSPERESDPRPASHGSNILNNMALLRLTVLPLDYPGVKGGMLNSN